MMLAKWFPALLWSAVRSDARTSPFWRRLQHFTYAHLRAIGCDFPPCRPRRPAIGLRTPREKVLKLVLLGFFVGVLALPLLDVARPVTGESINPLTTAVPFSSSPDKYIPLDDGDGAEVDSSAMSQFILKVYLLLSVPVCRGLHDSTRTCQWLARRRVSRDSSHISDPSGEEGLTSDPSLVVTQSHKWHWSPWCNHRAGHWFCRCDRGKRMP